MPLCRAWSRQAANASRLPWMSVISAIRMALKPYDAGFEASRASQPYAVCSQLMCEPGPVVEEIGRDRLDGYKLASLLLDLTTERRESERFFDRSREAFEQDDDVVIGIRSEISASTGSVQQNAPQTIAVPVGERLLDDREDRVAGQMVGKRHDGNIVRAGPIVT